MTYRGELSNYCEYADKMSALEYVNKVLRGGLRDPALSFELDIGFKFIKIPSSYLHNIHYVNFVRFINGKVQFIGSCNTDRNIYANFRLPCTPK